MPTNGNGEHEVLKAKEVSAMLRIPLSTVYGLAKSGRIKGVKIGKHWRYLKTDIDDFLNGANAAGHPQPTPSRRERREHARINCEIPAAILIALARHNSGEALGIIQNLCEGGVFVIHNGMGHGLRIGDPVHVIFDLPDRKVRTEGRIVRISNNGTSATAIKFRSMGSEDRDAIRSYVG